MKMMMDKVMVESTPAAERLGNTGISKALRQKQKIEKF